jgi:uncharacterized membrane protein
MHATIILIRVIHILSAIFWVGTLLFTTFYLFPTLASVGASADTVMAGLQKRGMLRAIPGSGVVAILSGATLLWLTSGGSMSAYARTPVGRTFMNSGGIAILAFLIGIIVARPAGMKIIQVSKELNAAPPGPARDALEAQVASLRKRLSTTTIIVSLLVMLAAAGMAVARYM